MVTRILVAVVADGSVATCTNALAGMRHLDATHDAHGATLDWTVTVYDDMTDQWQEIVDVTISTLHHVRIVSIANASKHGQTLTTTQRRARGMHRYRAVEAAWKIRGQDAWDAVWLVDADISFEDFDLATFLQRRAYALASGPAYIVQPVIRQSTQCWPYNWATYRHHSRAPQDAIWEQIVVLRTAWVESQAALIDARFLGWFYAGPFVQNLLKLQLVFGSSWGTDSIWCGAAKEYGRVQSKTTRDPCAVITVPIDHRNTKSIGSKDTTYLQHGWGLLVKAGIASFRHHHCNPGDPRLQGGHGCPGHAHKWFSDWMCLCT
mmetsp:Transcript_41940/g.84166  ORF Transcript_41940/g.84166 Transcript_41940/m.84166 type:complete len:320 (-) Transcript_41940:442-1401(-)